MGKALTPRRQSYAGLFMVALATLMYEILLTRIFSVTMWYHFAFMAISVAMFGMTVGAILVYLLPNTFTQERAKYHLGLSTLLFSYLSILSFMTHLIVPIVGDKTLISITGLYSLLFTYLVISLPFVFSGIAVCLALTKFPQHVSKLYAADLAGAAIGCILVIGTLRMTDGPTAVIVVAFLASLGATFFAVEAGHARLIRVAAVSSLLLACFSAGHTILVKKQTPLLRLMWVKYRPERRSLHEAWNSFSRVTVSGDQNAQQTPFGWGLSPALPAHLRARQLWFKIDVAAGTVLTGFDGDLDRLEHLKYDITNLVHAIRPDASVLVVGAGGGRDVLSALAYKQKSIVAVEINQDIIRILNETFGDFTGHLDRYPQVRFVNDEARSYIARQQDRFDIIQISLIDTAAATAAGAYVLTEHSLYTVEAWKNFLEHLSPNGVLTITRLHFEAQPAESYRLTSLASTALKELGVTDPRSHILIATREGIFMPDLLDVPELTAVNILVSRGPFSSEDVATLEKVTRELRFGLALTPNRSSDPDLARIASGKDVEAFAAQYPMDISAPTDNNPFFFHMLRLKDAFSREALSQPWWQFNLIAVYILGALLVVMVGLTFLCVVVPLLLTTKRTTLRGALPLFVFFASIGFGFMLIEISQMQRLIIFLGHPTYSLSVVLFSLLLSSGCGSYATQVIDDARLRRWAVILLLVLVGTLVTFGTITPYAIRQFAGSTTTLRILVAAGILCPLGLFMGMAFPLGMRMASSKSAALTPWLWGINGATSVCASVLAVTIALAGGISASFWTGVSCYVVALVAFARASRANA